MLTLWNLNAKMMCLSTLKESRCVCLNDIEAKIEKAHTTYFL